MPRTTHGNDTRLNSGRKKFSRIRDRFGLSYLARISFCIAITLFVTPPAIFAQISADPLDEIYGWFDIWEGRGYLDQMPVFRPYPENVIMGALERVAMVGDTESRIVAEEWLDRLSGRIDTEWWLTQETRLRNTDEYHVKGGIGVTVHGRLADTIMASGSIAGLLLDVEDGELLPEGRRTDWDINDDWSEISVAGRSFAALSQVNTSFVWGTESLYLHAGIMRRSFGPLHDDGIVLSPYAFQSPGLVTSWHRGNFRFSAGLFSLTATQLYEENTPFNADERNTDVVAAGDLDFVREPEEHPGKWVFIQDYRWQALPWLSVAFFESVTWGPRFELAYLMPLKWTFNAQGNVGFADSSKMGLSALVQPRRDVQLPFVVYVDDASFNDLAQFNFDTKLKLGIHTGVIWTPTHRLLRRVQLDYLALFPYMYTHDGEGGVYEPVPNYTSYTHQGESLGPGLDPNSDRLTLQATFQPLPRLTTTIVGRMIRHANASEGIEDLNLAGHDGSITDDGRYYHFQVDGNDIYVETGRLSFQDDLRFLNQDNIEYVFQTGVDVAYTIPLSRTTFVLEAGYQFEYIQGPLSYRSTGTTIPGRELDDATVDDVVVYETVAGDDEVNHYINFQITLRY